MTQQQFVFNEEQFRDLFDHANDMIHFASPEGLILYVNPSWSRILGYERSELTSKSIYELVSPPAKEAFLTFRKRIIEDKTQDKLLTRFLTADGKEVILEISLSCKYQNGQPLYTRGIMRDMTQRIENEQKLIYYAATLKESEGYTNQLLKNAPDAVIVIDEQSRIIYWNTKSETMFGWKEDEILGHSLTDTIIPPAYRERHTAGMQHLLKTGEMRILNQTIEITALNKLQNEFPVSLTISRSMKSDKSVFIAFIRDITEQKLKDIELEKRRIQLEKSNEELEQYASLTSHDLKEPLRKIMVFSDILLNRNEINLDNEAKNYISKISRVANHMNNLVEAVLNYSLVDSKTKGNEMVALNSIIHTVLQNLELSIRQSDAIINVEKLPSVKGNAFQLIQLFQNLIGNSLKYVVLGENPRIHIRSTVPDNEFIQVDITDNGIGFQNEYSEKIFGIFERLPTQTEYPGTGIGLAICKKIVDAHGGTISAKSTPGEGSTFSIKLPK